MNTIYSVVNDDRYPYLAGYFDQIQFNVPVIHFSFPVKTIIKNVPVFYYDTETCKERDWGLNSLFSTEIKDKSSCDERFFLKRLKKYLSSTYDISTFAPLFIKSNQTHNARNPVKEIYMVWNKNKEYNKRSIDNRSIDFRTNIQFNGIFEIEFPYPVQLLSANKMNSKHAMLFDTFVKEKVDALWRDSNNNWQLTPLVDNRLLYNILMMWKHKKDNPIGTNYAKRMYSPSITSTLPNILTPMSGGRSTRRKKRARTRVKQY